MDIENLRLNPNGIRFTSGAASANTVLPTTSDGRVARFIRILPETVSAYITLGAAGVVCTTSNILVTPNEALIIATDGATYIGYIQSAAGVAGVNVIAIDW